MSCTGNTQGGEMVQGPDCKTETSVSMHAGEPKSISGVIFRRGVTLLGDGSIEIPPFTEEQERYISERERLLELVDESEKIGGCSELEALNPLYVR